MLTWTRNELRILALWHFAHAWQLDESDWTIEITPDNTRCNRPTLNNAEAEHIGREMIIQSWGHHLIPWYGTITITRHGDRYDPPQPPP